MKKIIKGKTYNTAYDSVCLAKYEERIDGWAYTAYYIFKKKSTGEYFEYKKWSEWNDGWDIDLITEKRAKDVIGHYKKGETWKFMAIMAPFPGERKKGCYFWGNADDDPWHGKKREKMLEDEKKRKEEMIKKAEDAAADKEAKGEKTWGVMEITTASGFKKFGKFGGKAIPADKYGKVGFHEINLRIVNNDRGNGYNCYYKYKTYVVLDADDKKKAKEIVMKTVNDVVAEQGDFDAVMKGGHIVEHEPAKNKAMWKEIHQRIEKMNEVIVFGEAC